MIEQINLNQATVHLLGTAHVSQASVLEVERAIEDIKPDVVCIELCETRTAALKNKKKWQDMDIVSVIKSGRAPLLAVNLMLTALQQKMGKNLGVEPGAEMIAALNLAEQKAAKVVLADREVGITMRRVWRKLGIFKKMKLLLHLLLDLLSSQELTEQEVERLKNQDLLSEALDQLSQQFPEVKAVLLDERDAYLATKIHQASVDNPTAKNILAVIGAGHLAGVKQALPTPQDLKQLNQVPPPGIFWSAFKWVFPLLIMGILGYGFFYGGQNSVQTLQIWVLANGLLAALGAVLALGHWLTIIAAFLAAPLTSLNPLIAAGWVSGLVEAWARKPKVQDFERLTQDISSFKGFWRNKITRILLVVVFTNLGSAIGTWVALPWIVAVLSG